MICYEVLEYCSIKPQLAGHIIRKANLNSLVVKGLIKDLVASGHLNAAFKDGFYFYSITQLGLDYLHKFQALEAALKQVGHAEWTEILITC